MRSRAARIEFEKLLRSRTGRAAPQTPAQGFPVMFEFYRYARADDVDPDADGDMLLYEWGTHDFGHGEHFLLGLARQLTRPGQEDEDIWQLHLTFRFPLGLATRGLGKGDRWCLRPDALDEFERFVLGHEVLRSLADRADGAIEVRYECAG